ncbi:MAG: right-handed parallel beta-helix repeat-containing protein, partial [Ruminococcus sp.]|nr:right-handed parallel beta-helix repeat-containing protein [Ruminococcus sp.]
MRGFLKKTAAAAVAMCTAVSLCGVTYAATGSHTDGNQTELFVRASQISDYGTYSAIQSALDTARYGASENNVYRVTVEPGSYDLTRALHIYSNTILSLEGVTLNRNPEATANMLRTGDYDSETSGATGYAAHSNILIEGGVFDGGGTANTMIKVAHATDFTMRGITFQNEHNGHMMEIAGVDGFNVLDCTFKDQLMDKDEPGYEAIQLDILKSGHIVQCRSEALTMKNVRIEDCDFINCPRGIGTHTAILNAPFDGIKIRNNTFTDMGSAAIQGMNWKNCEISGNTINGTPRGISIYSMFDGGSGMYPASVLAREGNTNTDISESYIRPTNSNILIADNTIKNCGTVQDVYAPYESAAISVIGKVVSKVYTPFEDGSGALPKGDYYITGIKICGNTIDTNGYGVQLSDASSVTLSNNLIRCAANAFDNVKYHGIAMTDDTVVNSISECDIEGSVNSGIYADDAWIGSVSDCRVVNSGADAIQLNNSSYAKSVVNNYVSGSKDCGVSAMSGSKIVNVSGNTIRDYKYKAVYQAKNATATAGKNYSDAAEVESISLNWGSIAMGVGESYVYSLTSYPAEAKTCFMWSTSDPSVAKVEVDGRIRAVGKGSCEVTVTAGNGVTASSYVRVYDAPDSLSLNKNMLELGEGEQFDLNSAIPAGTAAQKIYYYSNNDSSVAVEKIGGMVTAKSVGTATIVAKT